MAPRPKATPRTAATGDRFGAEYYRRFYEDPTTRVGDRATVRKLADFVSGYLRYLDVPVRSILDVGCGQGHWRSAAAAVWPRARYHGVENSEYLCEQFGWIRGSAVDFVPRKATGQSSFDLVVCQGVLQYLDDRAAVRAIANLARWCRGALYLEALTSLDWQKNVDRSRTDGDVHLRTGAWYRSQLDRHFVACGGGVFCSRRAGVALFELEGT
jgi:SAM-dependent methyltransferase